MSFAVDDGGRLGVHAHAYRQKEITYTQSKMKDIDVPVGYTVLWTCACTLARVLDLARMTV